MLTPAKGLHIFVLVASSAQEKAFHGPIQGTTGMRYAWLHAQEPAAPPRTELFDILLCLLQLQDLLEFEAAARVSKPVRPYSLDNSGYDMCDALVSILWGLWHHWAL